MRTNRSEIVEVATQFYEDLYDVRHETGKNATLDRNKPRTNQEEAQFHILKDEIVSAMKQLKKSKAPGEDQISNELIIHGNIPIFVNLLTNLFNKIMINGKMPN